MFSELLPTRKSARRITHYRGKTMNTLSQAKPAEVHTMRAGHGRHCRFAAIVPAVLMMAPAVASQLASQLQLGPVDIGNLFSAELGP
jgi:hypothetical protein